MKLLIAVNVDWFFISHRLDIARAAIKAGWEVHVATTLTEEKEKLEGYGFTVHSVAMHRSSWNPVDLVGTLLQFVRLFRDIRPDVAHLVTIKPVLLGGIAARLSQVPGVLFAVSGLGHVFVAKDLLGSLRKRIVQALYMLAMSHRNKRVIFQNEVDEAQLRGIGCVTLEESVRLPGSGFDVDSYKVSPIPNGRPIFLMAARLIHTKGVMEFVKAADQLHSEGVSAEFWLVGGPDSLNPEGLTVEEVEEIKRNSCVQVLGHRTDVPDLMRSAAVVVLPSYYGEGLPKVLIEAASAGRAVVTTNTPGCRDAIEDGKTGYLVPARDVGALAGAMKSLAYDVEKIEEFGKNGRIRAESLFRIQEVVDKHLELYSELAGRSGRSPRRPARSIR